MKFCLGIPTINRADLLEKSLGDLELKCPEVELVVVDNGHQKLSSVLASAKLHRPPTLIENESNKGVAGSWNQIASFAWSRSYSWVWIANDDVILGKRADQIAALCDEYDAREDGPRLAASSLGWSSFILPKLIWDEVGEFDEEFFPAYFEDDDYIERLRLAGKPREVRHELNAELYRESMTAARDPSVKSGWAKNEQRFAEKWGVEALYRLMNK